MLNFHVELGKIKKDPEDMSESEKRDVKWVTLSKAGAVFGFFALCFFHIYNFFFYMVSGCVCSIVSEFWR